MGVHDTYVVFPLCSDLFGTRIADFLIRKETDSRQQTERQLVGHQTTRPPQPHCLGLTTFDTMSSSAVTASASAASSSARSLGGRSSENLPPRVLARVAREVKALLSNPPDGIQLVTDPETGMPTSLDNLMVSVGLVDEINARCGRIT